MPLENGARLGSYEIGALIGAGGMGEVYRARDTRLNREVAIKILPEVLAQDPERMARFSREAQILAALNHPNIAQIYGVEERALVMELVEGAPVRGPLPAETALQYARQIAGALEAAHEKGIIHRDLKPANIMVTPAGVVKVLDFGLAKAADPAAASAGTGADPAHSPTVTMSATRAGVILGTAAYMSPEQARGKPADFRADVWSFGTVLHEMVTGSPTFAGETITDILASVVKEQPALDRLPPGFRRIVDRCLQKDPRQRWQAMGDLRVEIEALLADPNGISAGATPAPIPLWKWALPAVAAAVIASAITAGVFWRLQPTAPGPVARFSVALPAGQAFTNSGRRVLAISPDGTQMVYVADRRLYLRLLAEQEARPIPGTESVNGVLNPAFSPDGRSIAYWDATDATIKRIAVGGGAPLTVCSAGRVYGISWDASGILFGRGEGGILRVSSSGGKPELLVRVQPGELAAHPRMLPGEQEVLFTLTRNANDWDKASVVAQTLKSGARKTLIEGGSDAHYLPTGHLVYTLSGLLLAVPFHLGRLEAVGGPAPIVQGLLRGAVIGAGQFDISRTGSLIYLPGPVSPEKGKFSLALFDRQGNREVVNLPPANYGYPRVSHDGKRLVYHTNDEKESAVWIYDLSGASAPRRLTFQGANRYPVWSADGERIAFQSDREGDLGIFWQRADGTGAVERLTRPQKGEAHIPDSFSPDGRYLSFSAGQGGVIAVWILSLNDRKATLFAEAPSTRAEASVFSPDGRWVAYSVPNATGAQNSEIYVQPHPATGAKYQAGSGTGPTWSGDGKQLFYSTGPQTWEVVNVTAGAGLAFSPPTPLPTGFSVGNPVGPRARDLLPDGRFIAAVNAAPPVGRSAGTPPIEVVLNWFEELKQHVPAR
jgi:serine/threonine-protein kinase